MREAAAIVRRARPDYLDINYGCPVNKVACKSAGCRNTFDIDKMVTMTEDCKKAS